MDEVTYQSPSYVTTCTEDEEGNVILEFPEELLDAMGWGEGTLLDIGTIGDRITIREIKSDDPDEVGGCGGGECPID